MVPRGSTDGFDRPGASLERESAATPSWDARIACVVLPELPLQLLLRRHQDWRGLPAAVVDHDKPQGILLWVNEAARLHRILPGMRYAAGLSLTRELRAGVIEEAEISRAIGALEEELRFYTPEVEPSTIEPGVFWLGAGGLVRLHPSLVRWARLVRTALFRRGYEAEVAVGFSRFGAYVGARCGARFLRDLMAADLSHRDGARGVAEASARGDGSVREEDATGASAPCRDVLVFRSREAEIAIIRRAPIARLGIDPELRDALAKLAIHDLGGFADLPPEGLQKRFSPEVLRLHQLLRGELWDPIQPRPIQDPLIEGHLFDDPEEDRERLLGVLAILLDRLLRRLGERGQELVALRFDLVLEHDGVGDRDAQGGRKVSPRRSEHLRPARPTLEAGQLLQLIRLRLESLALPAGIVELELAVEGVNESREQLELFAGSGPRDLEAATRAFARLRAELGDGVVVRARLTEGHLPEARFSWEPMGKLQEPRARRVHARPLIRRFLATPWPLPSRPRHEPDGWLVTGLEGGSAEEILGPYIVSGGWWRRPVHREYHYIRTDKGRWLWVYYDRERRRWYLQGEVE